MLVRPAREHEIDTVADVFIASFRSLDGHGRGAPVLRRHCLRVVELIDGSGNEEREPAARYELRP